jgi:hypothetical protein
MNKGYGGEQNKMKDSMIKSAHGYLGPHDHDRKLKVGDVQSMVFRPSPRHNFLLKYSRAQVRPSTVFP